MESKLNQAKSSLVVPRVVWFALTASQFIYLFIANFLKPSSQPADTFAQFLLPALGLAIVEGAASVVIFRKYLEGLTLTSEELALPDASATLCSKIARSFPKLIIALALNESICIIGFLFGFLGGQAERMLPFMALSLALNAYMFPRIPQKR